LKSEVKLLYQKAQFRPAKAKRYDQALTMVFKIMAPGAHIITTFRFLSHTGSYTMVDVFFVITSTQFWITMAATEIVNIKLIPLPSLQSIWMSTAQNN